MIELLVPGPLFYWCQLDEDLFFAGLKKILCVTQVAGRERSLLVHVDDSAVTDDDLHNLIGLFTRYELDVSVLKALINDANRQWVTRGNAYWHSRMFG